MEFKSFGIGVLKCPFLQRMTKRIHKVNNRIHKEGNFTILKSLHYSPVPDDIVENTTRLVEHSDLGSTTLFFQDKIGYLQVQNTELTKSLAEIVRGQFRIREKKASINSINKMKLTQSNKIKIY